MKDIPLKAWCSLPADVEACHEMIVKLREQATFWRRRAIHWELQYDELRERMDELTHNGG